MQALRTVLTLCILIAVAPMAGAQITVCATGPADYATLQDAIDAASAFDTIEICAEVHTEAGIVVDKPLTLVGAGQTDTIVQAAATPDTADDRVFLVLAPEVVFADMTIRHGVAPADPLPFEGELEDVVVSGAGGGIAYAGEFVGFPRVSVIDNCTITQNHAGVGGGVFAAGQVLLIFESTISENVTDVAQSEVFIEAFEFVDDLTGVGGGGIATTLGLTVVATSTVSDNETNGLGGGLVNFVGQLLVDSSTISGNLAVGGGEGFPSAGGGLAQIASRPLAAFIPSGIFNSTVGGNSTDTVGGGVYSGVAIGVEVFFSLNVLSSTVNDNSAGVAGGGLFNDEDGALAVGNSIVSNNPGGDCALDEDSFYDVIGPNLDTDGSCPGFSISEGDPDLGPLADNGGPTLTHALGIDSEALEAGSSCGGFVDPGVDQRLQPRPRGAACDLGAYEDQIEALCVDDFEIEADALTCTSAEIGSIDDGSFDFDGDDFTVSQDTFGPFDLGDNVVTLTAEDDHGVAETCTTTVTVIDVTAPVLSDVPGPITVDSCEPTAVEVPLPTADDACDDLVTVTSDAPAIFPLGTTTVTFTATDEAGNTTEATTTVTVTDDSAPVITVAGDPIVLWPPNHKYHTIALDDFFLDATDTCGGEVTVVLSGVSSDEPEDVGGGGGDGRTFDDIVIAGDCESVDLRAERQGGNNGRVYTLSVEATDESGNTGSEDFEVWVPHSRNSGAIADDPAYSVAGSCGGTPI